MNKNFIKQPYLRPEVNVEAIKASNVLCSSIYPYLEEDIDW